MVGQAHLETCGIKNLRETGTLGKLLEKENSVDRYSL